MLPFSKMIISFFILHRIQAVIHELPSYFPRCHRTDPDLNECLLKSTETVKPFLAKGVPELNLAPLDDLKVPEVSVVEGGQAFNFKAKFNNILVTGLTNYKFSKFEFDVPNLQFFAKCQVTNTTITGDYEAEGRILVIPIAGQGPIHLRAESLDVTFYQKVKLITKGGQEYIHPIFTNSTVQAEGVSASIQGLFNGDDELNEAINKVLNENVDVIIDDLRPSVSKVISQILNDFIIRNIITLVPYDKLY